MNIDVVIQVVEDDTEIMRYISGLQRKPIISKIEIIIVSDVIKVYVENNTENPVVEHAHSVLHSVCSRHVYF